jgi:hypothetical protein
VFEEAFRAALVAEGFVIPKTGDMYEPNGEHRELDASVRIGDCLILFECVSIERPLDYEIGRIKTLAGRQKRLEKKVEQALTLREFVVRSPVGRNYDFRWATTVSTFVVSPFIEWIWDRSERLWHDATTPRFYRQTKQSPTCGSCRKVSIELGGNAPSIVFDDADIEMAARARSPRNSATPPGPVCAPTASWCRTASTTRSPSASPRPPAR